MKTIRDAETIERIKKILEEKLSKEELNRVAQKYIYRLDYVADCYRKKVDIINESGETYVILGKRDKAVFLTHRTPSEMDDRYVLLLEVDAISYDMKNWQEFDETKTILVRRDRTIYIRQGDIIYVKPVNSTEMYVLQVLYKEHGGK